MCFGKGTLAYFGYNNATLENIDGVIGYSYTCIDNGEVVVIYR